MNTSADVKLDPTVGAWLPPSQLLLFLEVLRQPLEFTLYNKNFAIHFPLIDRVFRTYYLPADEWPETMGLGEERFPQGYIRQFVYPFRNNPKTAQVAEPSAR